MMGTEEKQTPEEAKKEQEETAKFLTQLPEVEKPVTKPKEIKKEVKSIDKE